MMGRGNGASRDIPNIMIEGLLPWPIRALVGRFVAPLVGAAIGVLLTLGLVSQQGGACIELLARELLEGQLAEDKRSESFSNRLPQVSRPPVITRPELPGFSGSRGTR
jgi:hypothetical protein